MKQGVDVIVSHSFTVALLLVFLSYCSLSENIASERKSQWNLSGSSSKIRLLRSSLDSAHIPDNVYKVNIQRMPWSMSVHCCTRA